ncbi:MAG: tRNA-intron lyase [Candidatus Aenigmarchaeota archaeon]|nr:tRNA-intron lyase [Candidatus Aenigmarchaeota archaeon]
MQIILDKTKGGYAQDEETLDKLRKNFFGKEEQGLIWLEPEEFLYLIQFQNAKAVDVKGKELTFTDVMVHFSKKEDRLFTKYNAYRDWRDRGLIVRRLTNVRSKHEGKTFKKYPSKKLQTKKLEATAYWFSDSLYSILDSDELGKWFFEEFWIGQYGIYKQGRGDTSKLSFLETVFVAKHFGVKLIDAKTKKATTPEKVLNAAIKKREYTKELYDIYEDWRLQSYVVKTGFKFGTHFRIYFPGASPVKEDNWIHSKHVLHVFPKDQKLLISEWSRAVRVAHGVKKTFILGIPEMTEKDYINYHVDFVAYRRKKEGGIFVRETPKDKPRYLLAVVSEDEHIGGVELASLLKMAKEMGLSLMLSITDRETSITYYVLKQIVLPGSKYEYYEIEWIKP